MNTKKRILAFVLSLTMAFSMGFTGVFAADDGEIHVGDSGYIKFTLSTLTMTFDGSNKSEDITISDVKCESSGDDGKITTELTATDYTVTYESKEPTVATVTDSGRVTSQKTGKAIIVVTLKGVGDHALCVSKPDIGDEFSHSVIVTVSGADPDPGDPVTREDLHKTIVGAEEMKIVTSTDGDDVFTDVSWGSQETVTKFKEALTAAKAVYDDPAATAAKFRDAQKALNAAKKSLALGGRTEKSDADAQVTYPNSLDYVSIDKTAADKHSEYVEISSSEITTTGFRIMNEAAVDELYGALEMETRNENRELRFSLNDTSKLTKSIYNVPVMVQFDQDGQNCGKKLYVKLHIKPDPAERVALKAALDQANAAKEGIAISVNGSDVAGTVKWVTQTAMDTFNLAITAAQMILDAPESKLADYTLAASTLDTARQSFEDAKKYGTKSSGGSSGDGGGGSSGGVVHTPVTNPDKPTSNVNTNGSVNGKDVAKEAEKAIQNALASVLPNQTAKATVRIKNAHIITADAMSSIAEAAKKAGGDVTIYADTTHEGEIIARIYIDPINSAVVGKDINLLVSMNEPEVKPVVDRFTKFFENDVTVVSFAQQGTFGVEIDVAVRIDLSKIDVKNLKIYSYDRTSNAYYLLPTQNVRIDENGFVHFKTSRAGDILFSNGLLKTK